MTPSPRLADLVDLERLQRLLDGLSAATGISLSLIEPDGTILAAAGWQAICTEFHRAHEATRAACLDYDDSILRDRFPAGVEGSGTMRCPNGLCGFGLPLVVGGDHLATVFASQYFYEDEPVDRDAFRERARALGFDEAAYVDALDRVPVLSHQRVECAVDLLGGFVGLLADLGLSALEHRREQDALRESEERYRQLFEAESDAVLLIDNETGRILEANSAAAAMYGYARNELLTLTNEDLSAEPEQTAAVTRGTPVVKDNVVTIPLRIHRRKDGSELPVEITGRFFVREGRAVHVAAIREISARLAAEDALRFSEDKFAKAFHNSPDAVLLTRISDGLVVEVNEGFTTISGFARDEALGRTTPGLGLWAEPDERERVVADLHAGRVIRDLETRFRVKSGEVRDCLASCSVIRVGGEPHALVVVRDVTEQRRTVAALRASEALLRGILDNLQDAYVRADRDGRVTMVSSSAVRLYGYDSAAGMVGLDASDLYADPGMRDAILAHLQEHGHVADFVARALRKDGSTFWASLNAQFCCDGEGDVAGTEGFVRDISERVETERALRESEDRFKYVFDYSTVGMSLTLPSGELMTNEAGARMLGYTRDELARLRWQDVTHPDDIAETQRHIEELLTGEAATVRFTKRYLHRDGSVVWVDLSSSLRHHEDGQPVYLMSSVVDITERKAAEHEVQRLNEELEQRVRERTAELEAANRELESFAYAVSHDLRQPLRALDGFSQILLEDYGAVLDDEGRAHLARIRAADKRMGALIDALLELSRLTRGTLTRQRLDLSELARGVVADLLADDPERHVDVAVTEGLVATADRRLVRALLANLIGNAWKFTERQDTARIEIGVQAIGGEQVFFVRDDGAGFDMAYADKLFGAFQRLHSPGEFDGLGIGLATVQRIVHRHGGRVWAEGQVGAGATLFFTLPDPAARSRDTNAAGA